MHLPSLTSGDFQRSVGKVLANVLRFANRGNMQRCRKGVKVFLGPQKNMQSVPHGVKDGVE